MPVILLATSCSGPIPERQANNVPAKVLTVKKVVPACCAKKPSRFSTVPKKTIEIDFLVGQNHKK